jgi:hypothetical protein
MRKVIFMYNYRYYDKGLKSLPNDIPKYVDGGFYCQYNKLTSLQGAPKCVGDDFSCINNNLTSLQGAPKYVGGDFWCHNNTKKFTEKEVRAVCNVKGVVYV